MSSASNTLLSLLCFVLAPGFIDLLLHFLSSCWSDQITLAMIHGGDACVHMGAARPGKAMAIWRCAHAE
jgi:hypothetical protein